jgi:CubicO group peptidase (beta-lactamase class C family)
MSGIAYPRRWFACLASPAVAFLLAGLMAFSPASLPLVAVEAEGDAAWPAPHWIERSPADVGLDAEKLAALGQLVGGDGVVIRHGYLVHGWGDITRVGDVASAMKPLLSTLLLVAIEEGLIESVDETLVKYEPRLADIPGGDRITWRQLANQMSAYGLRESPGEVYAYNDFALALYYDTLMDHVFQQRADDVLRSRIAEPLGFEDRYTFEAFGPNDRPGRLAMSIRDFARFGLMYLRQGRWREQRILTEESVKRALSDIVPADTPLTSGDEAPMLPNQRSIGGSRNITPVGPGFYTFNWWVNGVDVEGRRLYVDASEDTYLASGHGGQRNLWVIPSLDLVVCWNNTRVSDHDESPGNPDTLSNRAARLMVEAAGDSVTWQDKSVEYARVMSGVKWTPVADGMPKRGGYFTAGKQYTGVPYSSVKHVGRYIGFDIFLKTFLAAVENPESVLYTENLHGEVSNAECYYGKVCSSYTSYALQCGIWYVSKLHGPQFRDGITMVEPQSAQAASPGDIIYTPPASKTGGSHVELVTEVVRNQDGKVTQVRVEESRPQTTSNTLRSAEDFDSHLSKRNRELHRITDLDAWRGGNRADSFLFPNYEDDSATPRINRVLLLDRGDWVPYFKGQPVKINIMDRDERGVRALVIKRGDEVVEEITDPGLGVVERSFDVCGDYSAYCELADGSLSQACEFAICELDVKAPPTEVSRGTPWEVALTTDNMNAIIIYFKNSADGYDEHNVFISEDDRQAGRVTIPAEVTQNADKMQAWLIGENRYGRLKKRWDFRVTMKANSP